MRAASQDTPPPHPPRRWLLFGLRPPVDAHNELQRVRFLRDFSLRCVLLSLALLLVVAVLVGQRALVGLMIVVAALGALQVAHLTRRLRRLQARTGSPEDGFG